jgi:hypothetical protein
MYFCIYKYTPPVKRVKILRSKPFTAVLHLTECIGEDVEGGDMVPKGVVPVGVVPIGLVSIGVPVGVAPIGVVPVGVSIGVVPVRVVSIGVVPVGGGTSASSTEHLRSILIGTYT